MPFQNSIVSEGPSYYISQDKEQRASKPTASHSPSSIFTCQPRQIAAEPCIKHIASCELFPVFPVSRVNHSSEVGDRHLEHLDACPPFAKWHQ